MMLHIRSIRCPMTPPTTARGRARLQEGEEPVVQASLATQSAALDAALDVARIRLRALKRARAWQC